MRLPDGVRRLFRVGAVRGEIQRDVDDELQHHFDEFVREAVRRGRTEADALSEARVRFGDERAYRNALVTIDRRAERARARSERLDIVARTLAMTFRRLRRAPGFSFAVLTILSLGIGANAVMFSVVDRLLLSPPQHVVDADQVRRLHVRREIFNGETSVSRTFAWPDVLDLEEVGAFSSVAGFTTPYEMTVGRGESAAQVRVSGAATDFFPLLGVTPLLGRFFTPEEDAVGAPLAAVLSAEYWERAFGADPSVLGSTLDVGLGTYTVVGVAPPGFTGAELAPVDVWLPLLAAQAVQNGTMWENERRWYWLHAVARLADGATVEAAEAEATAAHRSGRAELIAAGDYDPEAEALASPIIEARGPMAPSEARVAEWLAGVSLVVLLIACLNVANLLLARSIRSRRETAVRLTLGIGRTRLVGEVLAESLILAALGGLAALLVAHGLSSVVHASLLPDVAFTDTGLSDRLLVFTGLAALLAAGVTAVVPALQAGRATLADALRDGGRTVAGARSRIRLALLVGQATLSVLLLVGAGLFVRSLGNAEAQDLGFDADRLAVLRVEWEGALDADARASIYREALDRVRAVPGVRGAGLTYTVPFRSSINLGQPRVPGLDSIPRHHEGGPFVNKVGPGFFTAMGLEILQGRGIEDTDDRADAPPVAVVSESMARAIWPGGDAIGACMYFGDDDAPCTEVIGIVENSHRQALVEDDPHFLYYVNQGHPAFEGPPQSIMAGAQDDPGALLPGLRRAARSASPQVRFVEAVAMADVLEPELRAWRLGASMFTLFGLLALVVAAWGLYSVLAFDVAARHHELGVRAALGAGAPRLVRLVLRQALVLVGTGVALGLLVAGGAARFVEPLLFGVSGTDPSTYALVAGALMLVAALAGGLPAWRATRVEPTRALQAD